MTRAKILQGQNLKTGDEQPDLLVQLIKDNRIPKDLSGASEIEIFLKEANSNTVLVDGSSNAGNLNNNVSIESASDGKVKYEWDSQYTDTPGTLVGEFVVQENNEESTYPNSGTFKIFVEERIS